MRCRAFESNELFLPNVAQAGLTPLNTTGLFTDLSYDDTEDGIEGAVNNTESQYLGYVQEYV